MNILFFDKDFWNIRESLFSFLCFIWNLLFAFFVYFSILQNEQLMIWLIEWTLKEREQRKEEEKSPKPGLLK